MGTSVSITQSHLEHQLWINELEFYRDELTILERHLTDILYKNTNEEVQSKSEWFFNQFARLRDLINELEVEIREAEKKLAAYVQRNATMDLNEVKVGDQGIMRDRVEDFKRTYKELKDEFIKYENEWF
jgi:uncharacterized protein with gpF-like domain